MSDEEFILEAIKILETKNSYFYSKENCRAIEKLTDAYMWVRKRNLKNKG